MDSLQRLVVPPPQTLTIFQPTSSTVQFTVSTRSAPKTVLAVVAYYVSIVFKVVLGILALASLFMKWLSASSSSQRIVAAMQAMASVPPAHVAHTVQWHCKPSQ